MAATVPVIEPNKHPSISALSRKEQQWLTSPIRALKIKCYVIVQQYVRLKGESLNG